MQDPNVYSDPVWQATRAIRWGPCLSNLRTWGSRHIPFATLAMLKIYSVDHLPGKGSHKSIRKCIASATRLRGPREPIILYELSMDTVEEARCLHHFAFASSAPVASVGQPRANQSLTHVLVYKQQRCPSILCGMRTLGLNVWITDPRTQCELISYVLNSRRLCIRTLRVFLLQPEAKL